MSDARTRIGPTTKSFTVRGMRNGSPVSITWTDGALRGDPPTVDLVEVEADLAVVGGRDPFTLRSVAGAAAAGSSGGLEDPERAFALISSVIDRVTDVAAEG